MHDAVQQTSRRALTAAMLRPAPAATLIAHPVFAELRRIIPELASDLLMHFNPTPPRVTLEDIFEASVETRQDNTFAFTLSFAEGNLNIFIDCDRAMALAFADLAFGGTGSEPAYLGEDRPLSQIETRLLALLAQRLAVAVSSACLSACGWEPADAMPAVQDFTPKQDQQACIVIKLLVNAAGYDGEIRIAFDRNAIAPMIGSASRTADPIIGPTLRDLANESLADVIVALEPEIISLSSLAALEVGHFLPLHVTVHSPVHISSGGVVAFTGQLFRTGEKLAVKINDPT